MDVYLASGNHHKFEEFAEMVLKSRLPLRFLEASEVGGMPAVEESGETLEANAQIKAEALLEQVPEGSWVLADDSGLLVDALDGAPGVHSARYAGPGGNTAANNIKLLQALKGVPPSDRSARFACVLYFVRRGEAGRFFKGTCEGSILERPSGGNGFGYDPLFRPVGYNKSFAELNSAVKHALSHRGAAVADWLKFVRQVGG